MTEIHDIVIRNSRLRGKEGTYDIAISNGVITDIGDHVEGRGEYEIEAYGGLITPPLVNPHLHLCKVYTYTMIGEEALREYQGGRMEGSMRAIEIASRIKEKYREDWIMRNAERALREAVRHGTLFIRGFADTDTKAGLEAVRALLKLREKYRGIVDIQVVAFPQDGILRDPGTEEFLWRAVEMGADVVGGIPWIEYTRSDMEEHIDKVFEIALEKDRDVAMLTDDTGDPSLETTELLAVKTIKNKWSGRVSACHARSLALKPRPYLDRLSALLRRAGVSLISDPHTGPLHLPVKYMISRGVNVALGQDDISDAYYPYGRNNMLEVAYLASHITWSMTPADMELFLDMVTWRAARAMRLGNYGINVNGRADLVVHRAKTAYELVWMHGKPTHVIRNGRIIYSHNEEERFNF